MKREFRNKFVYCRKSDALADKSEFHVDHYRPKDKFHKLIADYDNLLYSCAACNRFKGNYWSNETDKEIVNPCIHVMSHHLRFNDNYIKALSEAGKSTLERLRLNSEESIQYRALMKKLIEYFLQTLEQVAIKNKREELEESLVCLAKLIGEDVGAVKSALQIPS